MNNESYLEFEMEPQVIRSDPWRHPIMFKLRARGEVDEDLEVEDFQFLALQAGGFEGNAYTYLGNTLT